MEYGLIGGALGHSFSKVIHEQLADYTYELKPLNESEFHEYMEAKKFKGINVTIPYKEKVLPYLHDIDERAKRIGAVNTIVNRHGKLYGYNTDYDGFIYTLRQHKIDASNKKVIVLGSGGASKAIIAVLQDEHAKEIVVVNRTIREGVISYEDCFANHKDGDLIVNTTPVGMYPHVDASPIDLAAFEKCEAIVDIIYNPLQTKLLAQAESLEIANANGLEMLIGQAKCAVEYFSGTSLEDTVIGKIYEDMIRVG